MDVSGVAVAPGHARKESRGLSQCDHGIPRVDGQQRCGRLLSIIQRSPCQLPKSEVLQGTLDLLVLKTLDAMGPLHGFGIARRIEQLSEDLLQLNEGTV